jgi:hypothetical protein
MIEENEMDVKNETDVRQPKDEASANDVMGALCTKISEPVNNFFSPCALSVPSIA